MKFSIAAIFVFSLFQSAVAKPIKISEVSSLDFGTATPGDLSKTIQPGTAENSSNGSFLITGDSNRAFSIVLPSGITMQTGNGQNVDSISISNFQSYPNGSGVLNATGSLTVFIGATRDPLRLSQKSGLYSGSYGVTVVY